MRSPLAAILLSLLVIAPSSFAEPQGKSSSKPREVSNGPAVDESIRTDIQISGIYPHLTTYGVYSQNGAHNKPGHDECGIGAIVPWAGRLWMVNYAPHKPHGSEHKLFSITDEMRMTIHPESVGGTPAGRMIHAESDQLLIGHHLIDNEGTVRTISPERMPMRVTAIARHLKQPESMVYYIDMEGSIWEADVHSLEVRKLFEKPVPGWHSKGGYTGQGRLVVSNNGELAVGNYENVLVGGKAETDDEAGVLAEWDGENWRIVERRQFTEVTGPQGIKGGGDDDDPIWSIGWDRRSLRLKLLDGGEWSTYLLPKAAHCNDARHGWYTEWPRIREITEGRWMMDMHGMFYDFPATFAKGQTAGLKPIGSHLRYIPDFCAWNGRLVLASDETSIQGNQLAGQPQSNLWFGSYEDLKSWGPASGYGGPWVEDAVSSDTPSEPFLVAGFDRRILHLATGRKHDETRENRLRTTDKYEIHHLPKALRQLPGVTVPRGDWSEPATGFAFHVNQPVTVYLAVDRRGNPPLSKDWTPTDMTMSWDQWNHEDALYRQDFEPGMISIPANRTEHSPNAFGTPHMVFVDSKTDNLEIKPDKFATVTTPIDESSSTKAEAEPVRFTLQVDREGSGRWEDFREIEVAGESYRSFIFPEEFDAVWLRIKTNRDCVATAYLHQTAIRTHEAGASESSKLFEGLADVSDEDALAARVYAAKRNRNLRLITGDSRFFEFTKAGFEFKPDAPDSHLDKLLDIEPEFRVDDASVILETKGKRLRLPKGAAEFDKPFASGWPRASREVESERHLANIHGTFYEVPLITNRQPPAFELMRPVSSHRKQITDFCSWNGLLVLAGVREGALETGHIFKNSDENVGLWFGGVDDLWKLGKPRGHGGPWLRTAVKSGVPSDPYLMTGYDRKSLELVADENCVITIEVDIDHQSGWHTYRRVELEANKPFSHRFAEEFSAHWIRFTSDKPCRATAQLEYR